MESQNSNNTLTTVKKVLKFIIPLVLLLLFVIYYINKLYYKDLLIYGEEQGLINNDYVNFRYKGIWDFTSNFGSITNGHLTVFTLGTIWKVINILELNYLQAQQFYFFIIIFITLIFSYLVFLDINKNKLTSFLLSIIYITTYNYFSIIASSPKLFHYALLPLSLFFWRKFEQSNKLRFNNLNVLFLIFFLSIGINLPQMLGSYSFIFIYILIFSLKKENLKKIIIFLLPFIFSLIYVGITYLIVFSRSSDLLKENIFNSLWSATFAPIHEIVRFFGGWWDYSGSSGLYYNHLLWYYHSPIGVIFTYIPICLFFTLLVSRKITFNSLRIFLLVIVFIFATKGSALPFTFIFNILFSFPILKIFREPWAKFILNLIFSVITSLAFLSDSLKNKGLYIFQVVLSIFLIFQIIPLTQGNAISHITQEIRASDTKIPYYWTNLKKWLKTIPNNKRILIIPSDQNSTIYQNNWPPLGFKGQPEGYLLYKNVVSNSYASREDMKITNNYFKNLSVNSLALGAIDYVLNKRDIITDKKTSDLKLLIQGIDLKSKTTFGLLDLYSVKKEYLTPKIRTLDFLIKSKDTCNYRLYTKYSKLNNYAFIQSNSKINTQLSKLDTQVTQINPTTYKVIFSNIPSSNVGLLMVETFNKGWKIYNSNSYFTQPIIEEKNHLPANCFSNFWLISPEKINKQRILYIRYEPQILYEIIIYAYFSSLILLIIISHCIFKYDRSTK